MVYFGNIINCVLVIDKNTVSKERCEKIQQEYAFTKWPEVLQLGLR